MGVCIKQVKFGENGRAFFPQGWSKLSGHLEALLTLKANKGLQQLLQYETVYWVGVLTAGSFISIITEPNNRVLLGALLFGCVVSVGVSNLCLDTYRRNHKARFDCITDTTLSVFFSYFQDVRFQRSAIHMCRTPKWQHCGVFLW